MWKAFDELEQLGWISGDRPRMISVQAAGCAPIVKAFDAGSRFAEEVENAATVAAGLRVPKAIGDFLILDAIRESGGTAITVTDDELVEGARELARTEGIFAAPEGGACVPALRKLLARGDVKPDERVVLFNTGSSIKYLDVFEKSLQAQPPKRTPKSILGPALRQ
jgi:threonine synthase